jgi:RND family efflux transporter MFP subunit
MLKGLLGAVTRHKIIALVIVAAVAGGGYHLYRSSKSGAGETRYVLAKAAKETLIVSVSGSGQVSASNQVDIKAKAAADAVTVNLTAGQEVKAGQILVQLDARDALKAVRDAETNLETARLSLERLKQPADDLTLLQSENALTSAIESKKKAEDDLANDYEDAFNTIANAFLDLPGVMSGLNDVIHGSSTVTSGSWYLSWYYDAVKDYDARALKYRDDAEAAYRTAKTAYDKNFSDYKATSRFSDRETIESLLDETYETGKAMAEAVKAANNFIQFYKDRLIERNVKPNTIADAHLATLDGYTGQTSGQLSSLLGAQRAIQSDKDAIVSAERSIAERTGSLAKLKEAADPLDIRDREITIAQRQNTLQDAREKLADYTIRAPFDGVIAETSLKRGDAVANGATVATLITKQSIAEISLNEIDAASVKVGQKTTLTFDAVEDLSLTGLVSEIDTLGTVSQGVVTYNVKIGFDAQDPRVKPGMSVSVAIVTDVKTDVLAVPSGAVKSQGDLHYVETLEGAGSDAGPTGVTSATAPIRRMVKIGLTNDTMTQIISGLSEGDLVVTRTIEAGATSQAPAQNNIFQLGGRGTTGGGGNAVFRGGGTFTAPAR